jgi:hypothetical protein
MDCYCPSRLLANLVPLVDLPNHSLICSTPTTFGDAQSIQLQVRSRSLEYLHTQINTRTHTQPGIHTCMVHAACQQLLVTPHTQMLEMSPLVTHRDSLGGDSSRTHGINSSLGT